jgi:transposase
MVTWLAGRELPEDWKKQTIALAQWRSGDRLAGLIRWWADHRLEGDEEIYRTAQEWRKQYLHLANWWRNLEDQMRMRVREQYRIFASHVARDYAAVYVEEFDLREVAKEAPAESEGQNTASSGYRQMVSPSVLRSAVKNACFREGVSVVEVAAEYTTRVCHHCGYAGQWDQAAAIMHRCDGCGTLWDQDANAARNLLALGLASGGAAPTKNQQDRERKWDRVRRRSEKTSQTVDGKA